MLKPAKRGDENSVQPPVAFQFALRLAAVVAHVIFMMRMLDGYGIEEDYSMLAPWIVMECIVVGLIFGTPFLLLMRLAAAAGLSVFALWSLGYYREDPGRITLLLLVITEVITVVLVLVARPAMRVDWTPVGTFFAAAATFYFFALNFTRPEWRLIPEWAGATLQGTGVIWAIFAKLSLGRSFGVLPADRGIVTRGAYRSVRHPIYLGYFLYHLGFLLPNFGRRNLAVFVLLYTFQIVRIFREERLLVGNPEYQAYCQKVRWRFLPLVF